MRREGEVRKGFGMFFDFGLSLRRYYLFIEIWRNSFGGERGDKLIRFWIRWVGDVCGIFRIFK